MKLSFKKYFSMQISPVVFISGVMIAYGLYEVIIGWEQLLGFKSSGHHLFPVTGSFFNPGPYCLFLAVLMPMALFNIVREKKGLFYWEGVVYLISAVALLPVLMGRTGWIAALIGMGVTEMGLWKIKLTSGKMRMVFLVLVPFMIIGIGYLLYLLKPESALGRIFLWKTGLDAMFINPLEGVGWHKVAGAMGLMQENYFRINPESVFTRVAGSPEYAFNEYLQIGIAFGIPTLILFVAILILATYLSYKGGEYGIAGSIIALATGCLATYPFRFPEFIILTIVLLTCGLFSVKTDKRGRLLRAGIYAFIILIGVFSLSGIYKNEEITKEWNVKKYAYRYSLSDEKIIYLDSMAEIQGNNPDFLFDYGKALRESGRYEKSNQILIKGTKISSDAMFLNLIGRNFQDLGKPGFAEEYYHRSINRLPGRLYPYYLLGKLYADSIYGNKEKFLEIYNVAMNIEPKVMSTAIREMKDELEELHGKLMIYGSNLSADNHNMEKYQ